MIVCMSVYHYAPNSSILYGKLCRNLKTGEIVKQFRLVAIRRGVLIERVVLQKGFVVLQLINVAIFRVAKVSVSVSAIYSRKSANTFEINLAVRVGTQFNYIHLISFSALDGSRIYGSPHIMDILSCVRYAFFALAPLFSDPLALSVQD